MAQENWTTTHWLKLVIFMAMLLMGLIGFIGGQGSVGGQVRVAQTTANQNTIEILRNAESIKTLINIQNTQAIILNELNIKLNILEERIK